MTEEAAVRIAITMETVKNLDLSNPEDVANIQKDIVTLCKGRWWR
jgi:hypothetical protein